MNEAQQLEVDYHRRQIVDHLTSWVENNTGVATDLTAADSESLVRALNKVNGVLFDMERKTGREPVGMKAQRLLYAAELMMQRATEYARRGETSQEAEWVRATSTMLETAGRCFADVAKECTECERSHLSAGIFCLSCRRPFQENMPAEAEWFIVYEDETGDGSGVWNLRNGIGHETLIFAYNEELTDAGEPEAKLWAADVLKADYALAVSGWSPAWEGEPQYLTPDYWIAATQTN